SQSPRHGMVHSLHSDPDEHLQTGYRVLALRRHNNHRCRKQDRAALKGCYRLDGLCGSRLPGFARPPNMEDAKRPRAEESLLCGWNAALLGEGGRQMDLLLKDGATCLPDGTCRCHQIRL